MKSKLLFAASTLSIPACIVCLVLIMDHYDLSPGNWGPRGVEFAEWHRAWNARLDFYFMLLSASMFVGLVLFVAGVLQYRREAARQSR